MHGSKLFLCVPALLAAALWWSQDPAVPAPKRERDWNAILGRTHAVWPNPRAAVRWFEDLAQAKNVAAREGRPLFVVMRCLPCKQCADFDAAVLEGGGALYPLLSQFVCVRLTNVQSVDLRQFPMQTLQDLDLSWWGWFLSPEGSIYGVFGGKDERGDSARISTAALAATLKRVLDHHWDPRRADWNVDIAPGRGEKVVTPFDLPGFPSWARKFADLHPIECLHCHQVAEILRQPALDAQRFDKARDLQIWPYPENIGIEVVRDDGLLVAKVAPDSPAARLGLQEGDRLGAAGPKKLFSQADLRAVLNQIDPAGGQVVLRWRRAREVMEGTLELADGWKRVNLDWRQSVADGNVGAHPGFAWPNAVGDAERKRLSIPRKTMAVKPYLPKGTVWVAQRAGLTANDVVLAVNGESPDLSGREFMVWFRTRFEPGDEVTLTLRNSKGEERPLKYKPTARGR
jgi:serine protease Do